MDVKESGILGDSINSHWYYASKALAVANLLKGRTFRKVLDVGAGSAFFSHFLLENSDIREALCIDTAYTGEKDEAYRGKPIHFRRTIGMSDADLVLMMDVLEHVEDDKAMLEDYIEKVPSGTEFLISVPAFQSLWSGHDEFLGHYRRYRLTQLENLIRSTGLSVLGGNYYFGAVFPLAATVRLLGRLRSGQNPKSQLMRHHPVINRILASICRLEICIQKSNRCAGLTAFCLARKK